NRVGLTCEVVGDAVGAVAVRMGGDLVGSVPGDPGAFVRLGVDRLPVPAGGGEEPADMRLTLGIAQVHHVDRAELLRTQTYADLLVRFPDHRVDHVLVSLDLSRGKIELPVGIPGVGPLGEQDTALTLQDEQNVDNGPLCHESSTDGRSPASVT